VTGPEVTSDVDAAVAVLRAGGLVGLPTETVYGLAALATNPDAVARIFAVKGRPADHPLIVHLPDVSHVERWTDHVSPHVEVLAAALWPGPLTIVVPAGANVPSVVTGGRPTVALRVPAHGLALEVLRRLGEAVAAPSANRFGKVSPTRAAHVAADLGDDVDLVLDGGPCDVGVESTIVDLCGEHPEVLRTGAVTAHELSELLGEPVGVWAGDTASRAPGMLASHYAPTAHVVVVDTADDAGSALHASGVGVTGPVALLAGTLAELDRCRDALGSVGVTDVIELEPTGDANGFAQHLYDRLRQVDRLGCVAVVVVAPPPGGVGDAVRDRLARAAAGSAAGT